MATTLERLIDEPDVESEVAEVGAVAADVADAAVVEAVDAGDGDPVVLAVEANASEVSKWPFTLATVQHHHVPATAVVARSPGTPIAQYASKTLIALEAWSETIDESQDCETADVIMWLINELESVQKHV